MTDHQPEEPRYTLQEAERILDRRECDTNGHTLEETLVRSAGGAVIIHRILCARCLATFTEVTPAPPRP